MSKILLATAIIAAYEAAKTHEEKDAVVAQIIESVKEQEALSAAQADGVTALNSAIAVLEETNGALSESNKSQEDELAKANETIADLGAQLDLQAKATGSDTLVKSGTKTYKIIGNKFLTRKGELNAIDLSKDKELVAEMIKNGSGAIVTTD